LESRVGCCGLIFNCVERKITNASGFLARAIAASADALVRRLTRYQRRFGSALKLVVRGIVSNGISHLGNFQAVDLAGIWLAEAFRVGPSVRTLCGDFGTPCRVNSAPYQLPALPCDDRAADRQEAADSSPFAPVISLIREALSQRPYGWPLLLSKLAPVGNVRESAISNWSGLNPKGPGLLL
jgi:hypothetical protein